MTTEQLIPNQQKLMHNELEEGIPSDSDDEKDDDTSKTLFMKVLQGAGLTISAAASLWKAIAESRASAVLVATINDLTARIDAVKFEKKLLEGNIEAFKQASGTLKQMAERIKELKENEEQGFWAKIYAKCYSHVQNSQNNFSEDICDPSVKDPSEILDEKYKPMIEEINLMKDNNKVQLENSEKLIEKLQDQKLQEKGNMLKMIKIKAALDVVGVIVSAVTIYQQYGKLSESHKEKQEALKKLEKIHKKYITRLINSINENKEIEGELIFKAKYKLGQLRKNAKKYKEQTKDIMINSGVNIFKTIVDIGVNMFSFGNNSSVLPKGYKWLLGGIVAAQTCVLGGNIYIFKLAYDENIDWERIHKIVVEAREKIVEMEKQLKQNNLVGKITGEIYDSDDDSD